MDTFTLFWLRRISVFIVSDIFLICELIQDRVVFEVKQTRNKTNCSVVDIFQSPVKWGGHSCSGLCCVQWAVSTVLLLCLLQAVREKIAAETRPPVHPTLPLLYLPLNLLLWWWNPSSPPRTSWTSLPRWTRQTAGTVNTVTPAPSCPSLASQAVLSRVVAAVRTEGHVSWAASAPALLSSQGGAASTTNASGAVVGFLMVSGFRKDAPTVAVVTVSCTASLTSSTKTAMTQRRCAGIARQLSGQFGPAASCIWCCFFPCFSSSDINMHIFKWLLGTNGRIYVKHWAVDYARFLKLLLQDSDLSPNPLEIFKLF